jgi:hypothetical protein
MARGCQIESGRDYLSNIRTVSSRKGKITMSVDTTTNEIECCKNCGSPIFTHTTSDNVCPMKAVAWLLTVREYGIESANAIFPDSSV